MPEVSVIIPNYNHAQFLEQRINSVLNQEFQDFELIILDDFSTDISRDVIERFRGHSKVTHIVYNICNSGSAFQQWKKGLSLAKGEWIWLAESDDWADNKFLTELIGFSKLHPRSTVIYCQTYDVTVDDTRFYDRIQYTENFEPNIWRGQWAMNGVTFIKNYLAQQNVIPNASAVIFRNRSDWDDILPDELIRMRMCGDWFFWIKLSSSGSVGFVNKHLNFFRHHESTTRTHDSNEKVVCRLIEQSIVEEYLLKEFGLKRRNKQLLERYLKYHHKFVHLFNREFYSFKGGWSRIELVIFFIKYKLTKVKKTFLSRIILIVSST